MPLKPLKRPLKDAAAHPATHSHEAAPKPDDLPVLL
jgi:hypothetical protein